MEGKTETGPAALQCFSFCYKLVDVSLQNREGRDSEGEVLGRVVQGGMSGMSLMDRNQDCPILLKFLSGLSAFLKFSMAK